MDSSYWSNTFPGIKCQPTAKLFFKKYLWRLVLHVPMGNLIYTKFDSMGDAVDHRRSTRIEYSWFGSNYRKILSHKLDVNIDLLNTIRSIKNTYGKTIRIRVEEPFLQIYAEDLDTIKQIAQEFVYPIDLKSYIMEVNGPESDQEAELLLSGAIIKRTDQEFRYKITIRDGRYPVESKQQILAYLESLGDQVKITAGCKHMLNRPYESCWGAWFYANDPNVTVFLSLINPYLIGNIHEMVVLNK